MSIARVTIGVPVFNGQTYLAEVLDSILAQTFRDVEIIVCDNASTDDTPAIAKRYAAQDTRIRYRRNDENIGASRNHNKVFEMATTEFFQWASADNVFEPTLVERCVDLLDRRPDVVLAYSRCTIIDEFKGSEYEYGHPYALDVSSAVDRAREVLTHVADMNDPIFGVHRSSVLRDTSLFKSYIGADDGLMLELALKGPFALVPEFLIRLRSHAEAYHAIKKKKTARREDNAEAEWFDPANEGRRVYPHWRRLREFAIVIAGSEHSPLEKSRILAFLVRRAIWSRKKLTQEILSPR